MTAPDITAAFPYEELFRCFVPNSPDTDPDDHDHDFKLSCDWGFVCNAVDCGFRTDEVPCPAHAPQTAPPGWRLVECRAEPRHWLLSHDRDDYGHGCPSCWADVQSAKLKPLQEAAERHAHRWCWLLNPAKKMLWHMRLVRATGWCWTHACWPHISIKWWWS